MDPKMKRTLLLAAVCCLILAGCGSSPAPYTATPTTNPPAVECIDGLCLPVDRYQVVEKAWTEAVGGWNNLTDAGRDAYPGGYAEYATANGLPVSFDAALLAAGARG